MWRNVRCVFSKNYMQIRVANANESPNLDANYSAQLIIICLMRRKVEKREIDGLAIG